LDRASLLFLWALFCFSSISMLIRCGVRHIYDCVRPGLPEHVPTRFIRSIGTYRLFAYSKSKAFIKKRMPCLLAETRQKNNTITKANQPHKQKPTPTQSAQLASLTHHTTVGEKKS
jgi:hypothetical protein